MMRWWNSDVYTKEKTQRDTGPPEESAPAPDQRETSTSESDTSSPDIKTRTWTFTVRADTYQGEVICVTGNCAGLGNWKHDQVLILTKVDEFENVWKGSAELPTDKDMEYRYVVCILVEPDGGKLTQRHVVVRRWETHIIPRTISKCDLEDKNKSGEVDQLSFYDNKEKLERGWLTSETAIQLKLFSNHLQIWKSKLNGRKIFVKVTPVNLTRCNSISQDVNGQEECLSLETMDLSDRSETWPVTEVAVMNQGEREFRMQEQFGRDFGPEDFITFQILVHFPESVAILIDFYSYPPFHHEEEPPQHVGFSYILPSALKNSEGQAVVPITSTRHRPIGQLTLEYIIVKPTEYICDLSGTQQRRWEESWQGLDVGHRGVGNSFNGNIKQCAEVRENTIASLKRAASHGADFVEFDVQLSKDLVPVLYHDFYVLIAMRGKKEISVEETIQLPVKDLTFKQLQLLKLYHLSEKGSSIPRFTDEDIEEHQPFPTLQQALEVLDQSVGFDIEIKWTMQLKDGTYELYHPFDLNLYLDTVLDVVLKYAGSRNIVFSCFHPDICSMIRLKQNKYPVMFLTQGITDKYPAYHDPRCQNVPIAVHFAVSMDILGISVHTEDLLRDSSQIALVKRAGLVLFCWGDDNNDMETNKHLKQLGIHAVIYDKIDQYNSKEVKESIFRLETRGTERHLIKEAAERAQSDEYLHSPLSPTTTTCKPFNSPSSLTLLQNNKHLQGESYSTANLTAGNGSVTSLTTSEDSTSSLRIEWPQTRSLATSVDSDPPVQPILPPQSTAPA